MLPVPIPNITSIKAQHPPRQKTPWRSPRLREAPAFFRVITREEAERAAVLLQTVFFQRAKLKAPRNSRGRCAYYPGMHIQPEPIVDQPVHHCIRQERSHAKAVQTKAHPAKKAPCIIQGCCCRRLAYTTMHKRHARWYHHCEDHHLPGC